MKTAIVTGGSRGIGFGIAKRLAEDGFAVTIMAVSPEENHRENIEILRSTGAEIQYVRGSIAEGTDREGCLRAVVDRYGRLDALINNAGVAPKVRADLLEMTEESYDRVTGTNTRGTMFMTQIAARQMIRQEKREGLRGIIVNVSSMSAEVSSVSRGEYCVSKAGVSMLTRLYADRLAGEGIPVYEVRPGIIRTDMTAAVKEKYDGLFAQGICPIARWGTPEDVAEVVSVFCSGRLKYTTGQVVDVDGGFHISRL